MISTSCNQVERSAETEQMILDLMPFARSLAFRMHQRLEGRVAADDLTSEAYFGLVQAARSYDRAKGNASWTGWAFRRVRGQMLDYVRSLDPNPRYASRREDKIFVEQFAWTGGDNYVLMEQVRSAYLTIQERLIVEECIAFQRTSRNRIIFEMTLQGLKQADIASLVGRTQMCVSKVLQVGVAAYRAGRFPSKRDALQTCSVTGGM